MATAHKKAGPGPEFSGAEAGELEANPPASPVEDPHPITGTFDIAGTTTAELEDHLPKVLQRKATVKPHPLRPLLMDSFDRDTAVGIPLVKGADGELVDSDGRTVTQLRAALRTAARQIARTDIPRFDVRTWDKSNAEPMPFIGFKSVIKPEGDPEEEEEGEDDE